MMMRLALALLVAALVGIQKPVASQTQGTPGAQSATFRSSVEMTTLDVTVVHGDGLPVADLQPADFTVRIDGKTRRVVRADWVSLTRPATTPAPPLPPEGYSSNEAATPGRLIVIGIDQPNIRVDGAAALQSAVNAFIDRLEPSDRVAAAALGGAISTPFTTDRASVKEAIGRMSGDMQPVSQMAVSTLTASEAIEIAEGSVTALQAVVLRECERNRRADPCPGQIAADARAIALSLRQGTHRTLASLRGLLESLRTIEAPKTLVMVSEGFAIVSQSAEVRALGSLAAAARTSIYGLRLDDRAFDIANRRRDPTGPPDRQLRVSGFDVLASISKGGVFEVVAAGSAALQRLEREISGYYLVGVESAPGDTDGKAHPITVQVGRRGAVVRARRELTPAPAAKPSAPTQLELVAAALSSRLTTPDLPLRVATFSVRDEDAAKIQVLIHADIGRAYTSAVTVTLGYEISDNDGTTLVRKVGSGQIAPNGISASVPYMGTASLVPGEYILKLAVTEGGRVGSVEHPFHAGLIDAGPLKLSDLLIGGSADAREFSRPTISYDMNFGGIQGYMEAYGNVDNLLMRYEVAPTPQAPALLSAVVPGRPAEEGGMVFSQIVLVPNLPAGQYVLRATLSSGSSSGPPLKQVARAFRVPPGASATRGLKPDSAGSSAPASIPGAATARLSRPFRREDAIQPGTLQQFRAIVAAGAMSDFDAGVEALAAGDFEKAEQRLKSAQRATPATGNSTAPLTYLAATYAASGRDLEASALWQSALFAGFEYPQIYEWLSEALIRAQDLEHARSVLLDAIDKWPNDTRFKARLAALER